MKKYFEEIHEEACENKQNYYIDPESKLKVLTKYFLTRRGWCCGSGCRHCPYWEGKESSR